MSKYREWIIENVKETYGTCKEVTAHMVLEFPELTRVRGHYYCFVWGEREHWWLKTPEGEIIDPTAEQFPSKGSGEYVEWVDGTPEPTGMCPNCGEFVYDGSYCCSEDCRVSYVAFCTRGF